MKTCPAKMRATIGTTGAIPMAKTIGELKRELEQAERVFENTAKESREVWERYKAALKALGDAYDAYHDAVERERNLAHPGYPTTQEVQRADRRKA
jgi:hypothetical protein